MSLSDDMMFAADTVKVQSGGKSFFDTAVDAVTKAPVAAAVSAATSMYNTGVWYSNKIFDSGIETANTQAVLEDIDSNYAQYYQDNKNIIDTVGFIGGAFIPGGAALKGLQMARAGNAAGTFSKVLGYTQLKQAQYLKAGLQEMAQSGGTVFHQLNTNKLASMAFGAADNVLQTAVFEVAAAAAMHQAPMLAGEDWKDVAWDITKTSLAGGLFAGGIEAIFTNRIYRDAGKLIDKRARAYDTVVALDKIGLTFGDKAFSIIDSALDIPKEVLAGDRAINFNFKLNGKRETVLLNTESLYGRAIAETARTAYLKFEQTLIEAVKTDKSVGAPVAAKLLDVLQQGKKAGKSDADLRAELGNYLFNLERMEGLAAQEINFAADVVYLIPGGKINSVADIPAALSTTKISDAAQGYRIVGDIAEAKMAAQGIDAQTAKQAWENGYDMLLKPNGEISINPNSTIFKSVNKEDDTLLRMVFNTRSGTTGDSALATIADMANGTNPVRVTPSGVTSGNLTYQISIDSFKPGMSSTEATARHLWAAETVKSLHNTTIDSRDFSLLDLLLAKPQLADENTWIRLSSPPSLSRYADMEGERLGGISHLRPMISNLLRTYVEKGAKAGRAKLDDLAATARQDSNFAYEVEMPGFLDELDANLIKSAENFTTVTSKGEQRINFLDVQGNYANWLKNQKVAAAVEMLEPAAGALDTRLVAYRLNVEHSWLEKAAQTNFDSNQLMQEGLFRPLSSYGARDNVVFAYDRKAYDEMMRPGRDFLSPLIDYKARVTIAVQKAQEAAAAVLGNDYTKLVDYRFAELAGQADQTGAGAGMMSFANADYGDKLRAWAQDVGKQVNGITQKRANETLTRLQPYAAEMLSDAKLGAELGAAVNKVRLSADPLTLWEGKIVDLRSLKEYLNELSKGAAGAPDTVGFKTSIKLDPKVFNFLAEHHAIHKEQLAARTTLANAQGMTVHFNPEQLYVPPVDTKRFPFIAFVRAKEGKMFSGSESVMITAKSANKLEAEITRIRENHADLEVFTKKDTEGYFKAKGDYEYSRALNEPSLDPFLKKNGILGDVQPVMDSKLVLEDFIEYHQRRSRLITQEAVQVNYAQTFSELQWLSDRNKAVRESKLGYIGNLLGKSTIDPFGDYMSTALDISKRSEFQLWHQMNEFVDAAGTRAYEVYEKTGRDARAGKLDWEEANRIIERTGGGVPFSDQSDFLLAQSGGNRNLIKQAIAKGNNILATVTLRLDFANALVNIISSPIMMGTEVSAIRNSIKNDPVLVGKMAELMSVVDPASGMAVPSTTKLMGRAVHNFWGPQKQQLLTRYKDIGAIKDIASQYHEMMADLSLVPDLVPSKWAERVNKWNEKIPGIANPMKWNDFSEEFTRFVGADVMRQITHPLVEAGRMSVKEQNAMINIFVNRVQGNYVSSQRPILFQGTIGAAIGLFQTYQFNLFQQLFRHIGDRNGKTIAVMAALQGSTFGLSGLPFVDAINTHLIGNASINEGHRDIYSTIAAANKEAGDWLMYGTPSAFPLFSEKAPALYTRGDLNPRHVTIIPTSPTEVPLYEAGSRVVSTLINTGKNIINGADLGPALLNGLEHNGISRPLAGIAQTLQGHSTTSKGSIISSSSDFMSIATASRIAGAKPIDEAIAMNHRYRQRAYQAADQERTEQLGQTVKQKIRSGTLDSEDITEFAAKYAASGGRIEGYSAAIQRWMKSAKQSEVNKLMEAHRSQYGKRLLEVMGGEPLEDLVNTPQAME